MIFKKIKNKGSLTLGLGLALLVVVSTFIVLKHNLKSLHQEVEAVRQLHVQVLDLDQRHALLDHRVAQLQRLPEQTKQLVWANQIKTMAHALVDLQDQNTNNMHQEELRIVHGLLEKISTEIND